MAIFTRTLREGLETYSARAVEAPAVLAPGFLAFAGSLTIRG